MRRDEPRAAVRQGMTLVEVLLAMTVAATVLVSARQVLGVVMDASARVVRQGEALTRRSNAYWTMRLLSARADLAQRPDRLVVGDSVSAAFGSWCDTPAGGVDSCAVTLRSEVADSNGTATLVATREDGRVLARLELNAPVRLRYLRSARGGGEWTSRWQESLLAPIAVEALGERDTVLLVLGGAP